MVNDLFEEHKDAKGKCTGECCVLDNPPHDLMSNSIEFCNTMRNWPKRCVIPGAEGSGGVTTRVGVIWSTLESCWCSRVSL
eukprot:758078-Alexandrium_andersonii.AAC.1